MNCAGEKAMPPTAGRKGNVKELASLQHKTGQGLGLHVTGRIYQVGSHM